MRKQGAVLVLGSNSFSGSNLVNSLLLKGYRVLGVGRSPEINKEFSGYSSNMNLSRFSFHQLDINHDAEKIVDVSIAANVTVVVNFSAQSMVAQSWITPEDWYRTNVVSLSTLLRELERLSSLEKFINFSTPEVYGTTDEWIEENFNFYPTTPYAISRAAGDFHLNALWQTFGFPVIFTRAANVYGPGQQIYRVVPRAILSGLLGRLIPLDGGGKSIRSFIHIDDVTRALLLIIDQGEIGESYHISADRLVSIKELLEIIAERLGLSFLEMVEMAPERPGKDFAYKLSSKKIRAELGWSDTITLEKGIDNTIRWARANLNVLANQPTTYHHKR